MLVVMFHFVRIIINTIVDGARPFKPGGSCPARVWITTPGGNHRDVTGPLRLVYCTEVSLI